MSVLLRRSNLRASARWHILFESTLAILHETSLHQHVRKLFTRVRLEGVFSEVHRTEGLRVLLSTQSFLRVRVPRMCYLADALVPPTVVGFGLNTYETSGESSASCISEQEL